MGTDLNLIILADIISIYMKSGVGKLLICEKIGVNGPNKGQDIIYLMII